MPVPIAAIVRAAPFVPRNLLTNPRTFAVAPWTNVSGAVTITDNNATAPNGTATAARVAASNVAGLAGRYQPQTYVSGANYTLAIFAKAGTYSLLQLNFSNTGANCATFDLSNGTVTVSNGVTAAISASTQGFYYCSIKRTVSTTSSFPEFYMPANGTDLRTSWTPAGTETVFVWDAQLYRN